MLGIVASSRFNAVVPPSGPVGLVQNTGIQKALPDADSDWIWTPGTPFVSGHTVVFGFTVYDETRITLPTDITAYINGAAATYATGQFNDSFTSAIFVGIAGDASSPGVGRSAGIELIFNPGNLPYGGGAFLVGGAMERDDIVTAGSPIDVVDANFNTNTAPNVTTSALASANELLIALASTGLNQTINLTLGGSDHVIWQDPDGVNECPSTMAYRDASGAGAQAIAWTADASTIWHMISVALKKL